MGTASTPVVHRFAKAVETRYWRPGTDYLSVIASAVERLIRDYDYVAVSEKALSTALGNIADEAALEPSAAARRLAGVWMRTVWGRFLAYICHMMPATIMRLREYPESAGSRHKELVLRRAGLLHALKHTSEGGIDVVNLPGAYAALPLVYAQREAQAISDAIRLRTGRRPGVLISDSDRTFSFRNLHFTARDKVAPGIHGGWGFVAYVVGAALRLKARATLVAAAGVNAPIGDLLDICELADHVRGHGAGRDVWEMAQRFHTAHTGVTWQMLESIPHKPIVIVRERRMSRLKTPRPPRPQATSSANL